MKLIRSCLERGWYHVDPFGRKGSAWPKAGPVLPSHSWFRWLHCSPGKHWSSSSLVPSLWLDVEVHRSFAAVFGHHSHPLWDEGAAQQARCRRWRRVPLLCVAALILGPCSLWWVSPGWIKDRCLLQGMGGAQLLTGTAGPVCSKLGHFVLPQVTSSQKSFLQGWRSLNPYYALTGIWHRLLEMDIRSWTHCNKGRTFFLVVFVVIQILKLWSMIWWIVKCPQSLNTFTSSPCSSLLWLSVLFSYPFSFLEL